jgi:hypothetical protein
LDLAKLSNTQAFAHACFRTTKTYSPGRQADTRLKRKGGGESSYDTEHTDTLDADDTSVVGRLPERGQCIDVHCDTRSGWIISTGRSGTWRGPTSRIMRIVEKADRMSV